MRLNAQCAVSTTEATTSDGIGSIHLLPYDAFSWPAERKIVRMCPAWQRPAEWGGKLSHHPQREALRVSLCFLSMATALAAQSLPYFEQTTYAVILPEPL
jgi:hypothetical protein